MADPAPKKWSIGDLEYLLNHVFLPPKLPQEDDADAERDAVLCRLVYNCSSNFCTYLSQHQQENWSTVINMLEALDKITGAFDKGVVAKEISNLNDGGKFRS